MDKSIVCGFFGPPCIFSAGYKVNKIRYLLSTQFINVATEAVTRGVCVFLKLSQHMNLILTISID